MWTIETLKQWHDFYMLVGTAGATLLALMFVAVSLGTGFLTEERRAAARTFMSPVVLHVEVVPLLQRFDCPHRQIPFLPQLRVLAMSNA